MCNLRNSEAFPSGPSRRLEIEQHTARQQTKKNSILHKGLLLSNLDLEHILYIAHRMVGLQIGREAAKLEWCLSSNRMITLWRWGTTSLLPTCMLLAHKKQRLPRGWASLFIKKPSLDALQAAERAYETVKPSIVVDICGAMIGAVL